MKEFSTQWILLKTVKLEERMVIKFNKFNQFRNFTRPLKSQRIYYIILLLYWFNIDVTAELNNWIKFTLSLHPHCRHCCIIISLYLVHKISWQGTTTYILLDISTKAFFIILNNFIPHENILYDGKVPLWFNNKKINSIQEKNATYNGLCNTNSNFELKFLQE